MYSNPLPTPPDRGPRSALSHGPTSSPSYLPPVPQEWDGLTPSQRFAGTSVLDSGSIQWGTSSGAGIGAGRSGSLPPGAGLAHGSSESQAGSHYPLSSASQVAPSLLPAFVSASTGSARTPPQLQTQLPPTRGNTRPVSSLAKSRSTPSPTPTSTPTSTKRSIFRLGRSSSRPPTPPSKPSPSPSRSQPSTKLVSSRRNQNSSTADSPATPSSSNKMKKLIHNSSSSSNENGTRSDEWDVIDGSDLDGIPNAFETPPRNQHKEELSRRELQQSQSSFYGGAGGGSDMFHESNLPPLPTSNNTTPSKKNNREDYKLDEINVKETKVVQRSSVLPRQYYDDIQGGRGRNGDGRDRGRVDDRRTSSGAGGDQDSWSSPNHHQVRSASESRTSHHKTPPRTYPNNLPLPPPPISQTPSTIIPSPRRRDSFRQPLIPQPLPQSNGSDRNSYSSDAKIEPPSEKSYDLPPSLSIKTEVRSRSSIVPPPRRDSLSQQHHVQSRTRTRRESPEEVQNRDYSLPPSISASSSSSRSAGILPARDNDRVGEVNGFGGEEGGAYSVSNSKKEYQHHLPPLDFGPSTSSRLRSTAPPPLTIDSDNTKIPTPTRSPTKESFDPPRQRASPIGTHVTSPTSSHLHPSSSHLSSPTSPQHRHSPIPNDKRTTLLRASQISLPPSIESSSPSASDRFGDSSNRQSLADSESLLKPKFELALTVFPTTILVGLLSHLGFEDYRSLRSVSKILKTSFERDSKEIILQRFLGGYGYRSLPRVSIIGGGGELISDTGSSEVIELEFMDLSAFRAGLGISVSEYARLAKDHNMKAPLPIATLRLLRASTRAWNRVIMRIRTQEEEEGRKRRHLHHWPIYYFEKVVPKASIQVFRTGRAPTLKVWVPTRNASSWMQDDEVVECEREVWRSGVWMHAKRGDIVQNVAIDPFGNVGKLIQDGKFLRDFSFTYDIVGHLPPWLDMLTLAPGYYHNVVAASGSNPVFFLCLGAFVSQIREKLALCEDQLQVSSPQGSYSVRRFVYRSYIQVKAGAIIGNKGGVGGNGAGGVEVLHKDWEGNIVVEVDGTAEHAAALLAACASKTPTPWRIVRERSRPGAMWLRPVQPGEQVN